MAKEYLSIGWEYHISRKEVINKMWWKQFYLRLIVFILILFMLFFYYILFTYLNFSIENL